MTISSNGSLAKMLSFFQKELSFRILRTCFQEFCLHIFWFLPRVFESSAERDLNQKFFSIIWALRKLKEFSLARSLYTVKCLILNQYKSRDLIPIEGRENTRKGGLNCVYRKHSPFKNSSYSNDESNKVRWRVNGNNRFIQVHLN